MSILAAPNPSIKPGNVNYVRLHSRPVGDMAGYFTIVKDGDDKSYFLRRLDNDLGGLAFEVQAFGSKDRYHVLLHDDPAVQSCDCRGFVAHGHCKHVEGLVALRDAGRFDDL